MKTTTPIKKTSRPVLAVGGGKRLNYTFFRPTANSKWKAINGNEIEYWSTGYYDLLVRNGSSGIAITVENVPAGKYTLKWKHMQRPDGVKCADLISWKNLSVDGFYRNGKVRRAILTEKTVEVIARQIR